jgi:hypothetical protein
VIPPSAFGANARLVIDYLRDAVVGFWEDGTGDACDIGRGLQVAIASQVIFLDKAIVAILIQRVSAAWQHHDVAVEIPSTCLSHVNDIQSTFRLGETLPSQATTNRLADLFVCSAT